MNLLMSSFFSEWQDVFLFFLNELVGLSNHAFLDNLVPLVTVRDKEIDFHDTSVKKDDVWSS